MPQVLSVANLSYSIAGTDVLKSLSFEVEEGSFFAIAGVNGAGKSTLIRLILDLIRPASGSSINLYGYDNRDGNCRSRLAYLPEKFDIHKPVSGWQYLNFVASMYHRKIDKPAVENLATKLKFPPDRLSRKITSYSKGMVQKLGIMSCFMLERDFLILDEPLSGLDPQARYLFKQLLLEEKSKGRTILYSTHMLADAEEICDQFGILHDGRMQFIGSPQYCLEAYQANTLEQAYMKCISDQ